MIVTLHSFLRHWQRAPLQLVLLLAGLALATALWSAVQAINTEARASYARAVDELGARDLPVLTAPEGAISLDHYVRLRRAGWQVSPVLEGQWQSGSEAVTVLGVDPLSSPGAPEMSRAAEDNDLDLLALLRPPGVLFAHPETLPDLDGSYHLLPMEQLPPGVVLTDISLAERLLDDVGRLSRIVILPDQPAGLPPLDQIVPELQQNAASDSAMADPERLTRSFHLNLTAFGLLSFCVGLFIVQGSVTLSVEQRRGSIRTLRCLGVSAATLMQALFLELILLALLAGAVGLVIGYGLAALLLPDVSATLRGLYGAPVEGSLTLRLSWVLSGLAMAVLGTCIASLQAFIALRRMTRNLSDAAVTRSAGRTYAMCGAASVSLIATGWAALNLVQGLLGGFMFLAGLMLGAALLLPLVFYGLSSGLLRLTRAPLLRWMVADSRLQLPGLSLSLMALLLAVATNIGVGTMVSSFRLTFVEWIDQRLAAEIYVQVETPKQAERVLNWADRNGARALPQFRSDSRTATAPLRIYGVVDDPLYRDNWPMVRGDGKSWHRVYEQGQVLINEQLAHREALRIGDEVALTPTWTARIAGIYSDYGNPDGQATVALATLQDRASQIAVTQIGLVSPPGVSLGALARSLRRDLNLPARAVVEKNTVRSASIGIFDRTFVVTGALNILTLAVAGFAMLTSFLSQWNRRLPQLAPVWAMGVTRRQLAQFELLRSLSFAVLTFLLALPLGLFLAWVLLNIINLEAFGWRLPMFLFPSDWGRLFLLTGVAAALAALVPVVRLLRLSPATLLGVFAGDR